MNDSDDGFSLDEEVNPNYQTCTVCTGDKSDNVWYVNGQCRIDQLTYAQVYFILQKIPKAKTDLFRITSEPNLIRLANETRPIDQEQKDDQRASDLINKRNTLPFYTVLRGNMDGSPR